MYKELSIFTILYGNLLDSCMRLQDIPQGQKHIIGPGFQKHETNMTQAPPLIAILEDDPTQTAWLEQTLGGSGFECKTFDQGSALLATMRRTVPYDLVLLDWELPGLSGLEVLRWIRTNCSDRVPVIFVTNRSQEKDLVTGFSAGADDYVSKPCRAAELIARIKAQLRRGQDAPAPEENFTLGRYSVGLDRRQICLDDKEISLTPKEFDLAALFLRHPGRLFSRDDISLMVWNREVPSTSRTLDTHLSNIRKKLKLGPATGTLLSASYALGYRLEITSDIDFPQAQP